MTDLDKRIVEIVNEEINIPCEYKDKINQFQPQKKSAIRTIGELVSIACMGIILLTSVTFAVQMAYQKIWREPRQYTDYEELENNVFPSGEVTIKKEYITEDRAKEIAADFIEKLGYEGVEVKNVELKIDYSNLEKSYYIVRTSDNIEQGLVIHIDTESGEINYFNDLELKYENLIGDTITQQKAEEIARMTYQQLGLDSNEYILCKTVEDTTTSGRKNKLWGANFYKLYGEIYNPYESMLISFIVVNEQVRYDTISIFHLPFEDNEIVISKEEAIEIASAKEKTFTSTEITEALANIAIEKGNTTIYLLENEMYNTDPLQGGTFTTIDNIVRKVWKVRIEHSNRRERKVGENANQYMKENYDKEYFVDATTGEIIGGKLLTDNSKG